MPIMANKKNLEVKFGQPEHVVDNNRARTLVANQLKFNPVMSDIVPKKDSEQKVWDNFNDTYGLNAKTTGDAADQLSDNIIRSLEGTDERFNKFTVESIAIMSPDMLKTLGKAQNEQWLSDDMDNVIHELPASNGKTITTVQVARTTHELFRSGDVDIDFLNDEFKYASEARIPRTWMKPEVGTAAYELNKPLPVVNPRGTKELDGFLKVAQTPFTKLSEPQRDAMTNLYNNAEINIDKVAGTDVLETADISHDITDGTNLDLSDLSDEVGQSL